MAVPSGYGTYVVFFTHPQCKVAEEVLWGPQAESIVLVCLSWGFQLLIG